MDPKIIRGLLFALGGTLTAMGLYALYFQGIILGEHFEVIYTATPSEVGLAFAISPLALLMGFSFMAFAILDPAFASGPTQRQRAGYLFFCLLVIAICAVCAFAGGHATWSIRQGMVPETGIKAKPAAPPLGR